jgi:hypothetical protein
MISPCEHAKQKEGKTSANNEQQLQLTIEKHDTVEKRRECTAWQDGTIRRTDGFQELLWGLWNEGECEIGVTECDKVSQCERAI